MTDHRPLRRLVGRVGGNVKNGCNEMARIVMKFGGTSVADLKRIRHIAELVKTEADAGHSVVVAVSAMAGETNRLIGLCEDAGPPDPALDARNVEQDAVVASGEQVTSGLTALVLQNMGYRARSWQGWQVRVETDGPHGRARIAASRQNSVSTPPISRSRETGATSKSAAAEKTALASRCFRRVNRRSQRGCGGAPTEIGDASTVRREADEEEPASPCGVTGAFQTALTPELASSGPKSD